MGFFQKQDDAVVVGYESKMSDGVYRFPVQRVVTADVVRHSGKVYFRVNEIASLMGISQKSQFASNIRKKMGAGVLLKEKDTEAFRTEADTARTLFISADSLYSYLSLSAAGKNTGIREEIINALKSYA